jgi:hypothetical protein
VSNGTPPRDPPNITGGGDRYEALLEVLQRRAHQEARDRALEAQERVRRSERATPYWLIVVLALISAWLWLMPPSFLRVEASPPPPVAEEETTLRWVIYLQVQRIKAYEAEKERLPDRLEEAGQPLPGMRYVKLAPTLYQLTGATDRVVLTYRSDLPLVAFVGSGADVVRIESGDDPG